MNNQEVEIMTRRTPIPKAVACRLVCVLAMLLPVALSAAAGDVVIKLKRKSGVYTVPCEINGVKRDFIFDTGAANTSLSQELVNELLRRNALSRNDFTGTIQTRNASGVVDNNTTVNIRRLKVGNRVLLNVRAIVAVSQKAPLLLGLNAIDLLGEWSMAQGKLILHDYYNPQLPSSNAITSTVTMIDDSGVDDNDYDSTQGQQSQVDDNERRHDMRVLAYKGDARAQYQLGMRYLNGDGVDPDPKIAVVWLRMAAVQNYRPAQLQLAECLELGIGVEVNQDHANYWRQKAEEALE